MKKICIIGALFVLLIGSLLHFAYDLSDGNLFISFISPINESLWEHFKLGFYSFLLYGLITYPFIKHKVHNFWFALGLSPIILNAIIFLLYSTYTYFTDESILWLDITIYVFAIIIAFFLFYKLTTSSPLPHFTQWIGVILILLMICAFIAFTLNPPNQFDLFVDPTQS